MWVCERACEPVSMWMCERACEYVSAVEAPARRHTGLAVERVHHLPRLFFSQSVERINIRGEQQGLVRTHDVGNVPRIPAAGLHAPFSGTAASRVRRHNEALTVLPEHSTTCPRECAPLRGHGLQRRQPVVVQTKHDRGAGSHDETGGTTVCNRLPQLLDFAPLLLCTTFGQTCLHPLARFVYSTTAQATAVSTRVIKTTAATSKAHVFVSPPDNTTHA